jgi:5'-3' exoribonuclease 2
VIRSEYLCDHYQCYHVLLCVGNDFLPHLPSLDIRDGAIDFLIHCYKEMLASLGNYLTSPGGVVNLSQADVILSRVGEIEEEVFRRRKQSEEEEDQKREFYKQRNAAMKSGSAKQEIAATIAYGSSDAVPVSQTNDPRKRRQIVPSSQLASSAFASTSTNNSLFNTEANQLAAKRLRDSILGKRSAEEGNDNQPEVKAIKVDITTTIASESTETILADDQVDEDLDMVADDEEAEFEPLINAILPKKVLSSIEVAETKVELKRRVKEKEGKMLDGYKTTVKDSVRLHESGWKDR